MVAFWKVAEHRGFTAAAADLEVSPSALSQAIRQLEARVGVLLLHQLELTNDEGFVDIADFAGGIAGVGEAAGPIGQLLPSMSPGYGFAAIIVAFVGRLHPFGILLASLLMSLLYLGGESAQIGLALPSAVTGLFQGTLLFFLLAADVLVNFRFSIVRDSFIGGAAHAAAKPGI